MIYLKLFLTFLKIGAVSFGGGYGMISLMREDCLKNAWLSEEELLNFIAVAESTPGPIAVNMATFIGSSQGGLLGALFATLGVVLPSFAVILLIATLLTSILKYRGVKATLGAIRPAIAGMILATSLIMLLGTLFSLRTVGTVPSPDIKAILIFAIIAIASAVYSRLRKKALSPIILVFVSGILGVIIF